MQRKENSNQQLNSNPQLEYLHNTNNGVSEVGCRIKGVYKGYPIERTAWCRADCDPALAKEILSRHATHLFNQEKKAIDNL